MASDITYRPGTLADTPAVYQVFLESVTDLGQRLNLSAITGGQDPLVMAELWQRRQPLFEHLANSAEHFWVAEAQGQIVGYARAFLRDGVRELTEFFVRPDWQSRGVGRELFARAFPRQGARLRILLATSDQRALARYLKAGLYPHGVSTYFSREPQPASLPADLEFEPIEEVSPALEALATIDRAILGFRRDEDHAFLVSDRQGWLYRRGGQAVGYGYLGPRNGPFALLDERDFPAALAHAESQAVARGDGEFGVELPLVNRAALEHLLGRRFEMDGFLGYVMSDAPFGRLENYVFTSPPLFL